MIDAAHKETDKILARIERQIEREYLKAEREVEAKLDAYLARFAKNDAKQRQLVAAGKLSEKDYQYWRRGQMMNSERWTALKETLAQEYVDADKLARQIVYGNEPDVYALNHNFGMYEAEIGAQVRTSYTLYNHESVERILREHPKLLPDPGAKVRKAIREGRALRWNKRKIESAMLQSILQGESVPHIAKRLSKAVGETDKAASIRAARTAITGAENAGREDAYQLARDEYGIEMEHAWSAVMDKRTRHLHRLLDGQVRKVGEPFEVDGEEIRFPGDPEAPAHLVYNCRCALVGLVKGSDFAAKFKAGERERINKTGVSWDEWRRERQNRK